jgi:hypothetical protein
MPIMDLLAVKAFPLHSQLEQRQRLKNLDRYAFVYITLGLRLAIRID